jgi:hypothetical protein
MILRIAIVVALLVSGCAYHTPSSPTPAAPAVAAAASITLTSLSGIGASAGQAFVAALVHDATGRNVGGYAVTFQTSAGVLATATITADAGGLAQATIIKIDRSPITITAHVGDVGAQLEADITLPLPPFVPAPPVLTPPPPPPVIPPPPVPMLSLELTCTAEPLATPTPCNVTALLGSVPMTSQIASMRWDWGDRTVTTTPEPFTTHQYPIVGTFTAAAIATMRDGSQVAAPTVRLTVK